LCSTCSTIRQCPTWACQSLCLKWRAVEPPSSSPFLQRGGLKIRIPKPRVSFKMIGIHTDIYIYIYLFIYVIYVFIYLYIYICTQTFAFPIKADTSRNIYPNHCFPHLKHDHFFPIVQSPLEEILKPAPSDVSRKRRRWKNALSCP